MKRLLTIGAIITLGLLLVTSLFRMQNGFDLLMTSSAVHDGARIVLMLMLIVTLIEILPRPRVVRAIFAYTSATITIFALATAIAGSLQIFDTLSYILAAVILMAESVEEEDDTEAEPVAFAPVAAPVTKHIKVS